MKTLSLTAACVVVFLAATAQAQNLTIPAGASVICTPQPSIQTLDNDPIYRDTLHSQSPVITCKMATAQGLPQWTTFIGEVRPNAGPAGYALVWQAVKLPRLEPGAPTTIHVWDEPDGGLQSAQADSAGNLRLIFKRSLTLIPDTTGETQR